MNRLLCLIILVPLAIATGCDESRPTPEAATVQASASTQKSDQPPPSQEEGMCREHGVLEALCPKCNPKLAVLFQSKGDWCAEHGFPESICPTCHPERGGKPAVDVSIDESPADGTMVILKTRDTARLAGIETTKALPGRARAEIKTPAVIIYEPSRVAQLTARSPGVIKRLSADIGTWVRAGEVLAVIESAAVSSDQSRLTAAKSRVRMTETNFRREAELEQKGISSKKEVVAAEQEFKDAVAELEALQGSLSVVGAAGSGGRYSLKAPFAGVVTARMATVDGYIETQTPLFEIVDTSYMWAELALRERDLGLVKTGMSVVITMDALEGHEFSGTITSIAPFIDPQTRTAKARIRLSNPEGLLRANMFGEAHIQLGESTSAAEVPRDAVQRAKSVQLVFVHRAENEYEARRVEVVPSSGNDDFVQISSGVEPGEEIVVAGSFFLKTETLKDAIGAGCCPE